MASSEYQVSRLDCALRWRHTVWAALFLASVGAVAISRLGAARPPRKHKGKAPPAAGEVKRNSRDGLKYVWIPPGTFPMGCSPGALCDGDEKPLHPVTITRGFWIGETEVTVGAYERFAEDKGLPMPPAPPFDNAWRDETMPMVELAWADARGYCQWAGGRLPTEAEWEYAARGGNPNARYGTLDEVSWYANNSGQRHLDSEHLWDADMQKYQGEVNEDQKKYYKLLTGNGDRPHEVAGKAPNAFGLFDTLGNVWEWCRDWFDVYYYQSSPNTDPAGPASGEMRVLRGGSYLGSPGYVTVSFRYGIDPKLRYEFVGGRCVLP
ncbi:MAG TPA: SUMF1/EgtB/PvdO family nonheme iron enzyme [Terriglobia bacterium]|nr:SUMF1/EgtB/PvdO family nonheme iron enzyme [Terriglobia bacterium]